jgi:transcriptional regulator with XRE-family HTH domain
MVKVLGGEIRRLRERRGLDRGEFASMVGLSYHRVYVIEERAHSTRPSRLRLIADALGVEPEVLVGEASPKDGRRRAE